MFSFCFVFWRVGVEWSDILYIEHTCTVHVDTVEGNFRGAIFSCISLVKQKTQFFYPRNVCALCYAHQCYQYGTKIYHELPKLLRNTKIPPPPPSPKITPYTVCSTIYNADYEPSTFCAKSGVSLPIEGCSGLYLTCTCVCYFLLCR